MKIRKYETRYLHPREATARVPEHGGACVCLRPVPAASKMGTTAHGGRRGTAKEHKQVDVLVCARQRHDDASGGRRCQPGQLPASKVLYESLLEAES